MTNLQNGYWRHTAEQTPPPQQLFLVLLPLSHPAAAVPRASTTDTARPGHKHAATVCMKLMKLNGTHATASSLKSALKSLHQLPLNHEMYFPRRMPIKRARARVLFRHFVTL